MIPKDCKHLAEVSPHVAGEKLIRHGHPSTPAFKAETP